MGKFITIPKERCEMCEFFAKQPPKPYEHAYQRHVMFMHPPKFLDAPSLRGANSLDNI